jgi:hypothetical protein
MQLLQSFALNTMSDKSHCQKLVTLSSKFQISHLILNCEAIFGQKLPSVFDETVHGQNTQLLK